MVSTTSIFAVVAAVIATIDCAQAHGYLIEPKCNWKDKETSEFIAKFPPPWKGDWDISKGDEGLLSTFKDLAPKNKYTNLRSLMDGDPLFGEECGFTSSTGTPVDPPSNGKAKFSRALKHAGPCEFHVDDKMVLQNDDCQSAFGDGIFEPVDYSSCAPGGCLLRLYWLALQRLDGKTEWQSYKYCSLLTGPGSGGNSTKNDGDSDNTQQSPDDNVTQVSPTPDNDKDSSKEPSDDTSKDTPAPTARSKCKGARRRD